MPYRKSKPWGSIKPSFGYGLDGGDPINIGLRTRVLFAEGGGNLLSDLASPTKFVGTNSPVWSPTKFGKGPLFNNSSNYYLNNSFLFPNATTKVSVSFWNYVVAPAPAQAIAFSDDAASVFVNWIGCHCPWADGNIYWDYPDQNVGRISTAYGAGNLGKWTHIALIGGLDYRSIYINGVLQTSNTTNTPNTCAAITQFYFGAAPTHSWWHNGTIDNFSMWDRQLTPGEIMRLYSEPFAGIVAPRRRIISAASAAFKAAWATGATKVIGGVF